MERLRSPNSPKELLESVWLCVEAAMVCGFAIDCGGMLEEGGGVVEYLYEQSSN